MPVWSIVTLDQKHIDGVVAIEKASFSQPWRRESISDELSCKHAANSVVIDHPRGQVVAYACLRIIIDECHLLRIAVAPANRRQGIATWLLSNCFNESSKRGVRAVYLEVRQSNTNAIDLYFKLGFNIIARRRKYYLDTGEDALLMMKGLEEVQ